MASDAFVKLMFTYYDDIALASLDDAAEVMFTRGLGYCGRTGSGGFIPRTKILELSRKNSLTAAIRVADALCSQVNGFLGPWAKVDGGYRIRNYAHYQDGLEAIQQRRKSDRDRKARERSASRDMSRDCPPDVTPTSKKEEGRGKKETPNGVSPWSDSTHPHSVPNAREPRTNGNGS